MILVLAGNKEEFNEFLEKHSPKNIFHYVSDEADYEGHRNCDLVLVGSYENNPLWKKMNKRKKLREYCYTYGIDILDTYIAKGDTKGTNGT